jgi:predicted RNA-binding Zn ribbon-like protein
MHPGTRILTGGDGQRYSFDAGALSMELLSTGGPGAYQRWEILHRPADLAEWLTGSRLALIAPLRAADLRIRAVDLDRIKHLRDTLWAIAPAIAENRPSRAADIDIVNGYAQAPPQPRVDPATLRLRWSTPVTGAQVLGAFARDALDLIGTASLRERIRECSGDTCNLIFLDTSRPGNRRWCSMERCGNRNKVRTHRARRSGRPDLLDGEQRSELA